MEGTQQNYKIHHKNANKEDFKRVVTTGEVSNIIFEMITQPFLIVGFHIICNKTQCSFGSPPDFSQYSSLSMFFDKQAFFCYLGLVTLIFLLDCIPLGGKMCRADDHTYNLNGFNSLLLLILVWFICETVGFPISFYVTEHILQLVVSNMIFQASLGIFLYIYSFVVEPNKLNPKEIGTPFISALYNGRQINPRFFNKVDVKVSWLRLYIDTWVIAEISLVLRGLNLTSKSGLELNNINWNSLSSHPTLVALAILKCTYCFCQLYNESGNMNSYFTRNEGMGYNTAMANSFRWSGLIAQTKYIMEHKIHYPNWELACLLFIYLFAQYVYSTTNVQKDHFRSFPNSPESKRMKKIPTSQGKDILCDGWWGRLRQPNIMADIVIHLTWIRFGFTAPPVLSIIGVFYYLVDRAIVSQKYCRNKYGLAWQKYCRKVKYVLVPFVY
ncbi:delta(14)-sterol reductase LBR-like isoform X3 [Harmonia axyridis]|uniref:delta(14)-sterol reductase LBR-like isoform X3 n=1 Tax=Harmonia axyridis TaxID=115357 RepID=UPI001E276A1A|nr:delta(14)-sterol reductase LBR-like isoform X3 [Harmonia axyridis]